jgi:hypothetical protein
VLHVASLCSIVLTSTNKTTGCKMEGLDRAQQVYDSQLPDDDDSEEDDSNGWSKCPSDDREKI